MKTNSLVLVLSLALGSFAHADALICWASKSRTAKKPVLTATVVNDNAIQQILIEDSYLQYGRGLLVGTPSNVQQGYATYALKNGDISLPSPLTSARLKEVARKGLWDLDKNKNAEIYINDPDDLGSGFSRSIYCEIK